MKFDIDKEIGMHLPAPSNKMTCIFSSLLLLLMTGLIILGLYQKDYWAFGNDLRNAKTKESQNYTEKQQANTELIHLQQQFNDLKKDLIAMSRENSVQQATNKALNRKLLKVEDELTVTKKKQLLFSSILAADDLTKGLHLRHFGLRKKESRPNERRYHYTLVLSQAKSGKKIIRGQYVIRIEGKDKGKGKKISFTHSDLVADGIEAEQKFSLKYYQSLEGDLILPQDFNPEKVSLWIIPKNKKLETQRKIYQWEPLISKLIDG